MISPFRFCGSCCNVLHDYFFGFRVIFIENLLTFPLGHLL